LYQNREKLKTLTYHIKPNSKIKYITIDTNYLKSYLHQLDHIYINKLNLIHTMYKIFKRKEKLVLHKI